MNSRPEVVRRYSFIASLDESRVRPAETRAEDLGDHALGLGLYPKTTISINQFTN